MLAIRRSANVMAWLAGAALLLAALAAPAAAGQRVALVIGNADYAHAPALATPLNDAADIGAALERLGFTVDRVENADQGLLRRNLRAFASAAAASDAAVVFYAGHGIAAGGQDFLVPVDARLSSEDDVEFEAVPLTLVERAVRRASGLRLIVLEASRESPFAASMGEAAAARPLVPGLARVTPSVGTLVAYAAEEGSVVSESQGRNSLYGQALLSYLEEPGLAVGAMLDKVREAVLAATDGSQEPAVYGSLAEGSAYLGGSPVSETSAAATSPAPESGAGSDRLAAERLATERLFWDTVKDSTESAEIQLYLDQYPDGTYAALARARLKRLGEGAEAVSPDAGSAGEAPASAEPEPALPPEAVEEALGLERDMRRLIQVGLAQLGFDPGSPDGVFGRRTRAAIGAWQTSEGKPVTGYLDAETAKRLAVAGNEAPPPEEKQGISKDSTVAILSEALKAAHKMEDFAFRGLGLAEIGELVAKMGDRRAAETIFNTAIAAAEASEYIRGHVLARIAETQAKAGDVRAAFATAQLISEENADDLVDALAGIAEAQAEAGEAKAAERSLERALAVAQRVEAGNRRESALFGVVRTEIVIGDLRGAFAVTERISRDSHYFAWALAEIAEAQAKAGDGGAAARTLKRAWAAADGMTDDYNASAAFEHLAGALARTGDVRTALAAVHWIRDEDREDRRESALAEIAEAQAETGDVRAAFATVQRITNKSDRSEAFASIAGAQAKAGDIRGALATADRINNQSGDAPSTLYKIGQAQAKAGDTASASRTMERAVAMAARITGKYERNRAVYSIVYDQAGAEDFRGALATARRIVDPDRRADALVEIARAQLEGN